MKVVSTEALTKLIQLVKSAFIKVEDVVEVSEIETEIPSEVTLAAVATSGDYDDLINKPSSRNIGEIIQSTLPLADAGLHLLDGSLISGSGSYAAFVTYIAGLVSSYPSAFTTESAWQNTVSSKGVCGKFVYDSTNNTVRLPKITGFTEGTTDTTALGELTSAGLPNITGTFNTGDRRTHIDGTSGAIYRNTIADGEWGGQSGAYGNTQGVGFDASRSNSIYGNSNTVQPQSIKALYYIVIATSTKTGIQVDIDEITTDLNGKADTDLVNVTDSGKILMSSMGMLSNVRTTLTLGATWSYYTAPANGYFAFSATSNRGSSNYAHVQLSCMSMVTRSACTAPSARVAVYMPVKKGDSVQVGYQNVTDTNFIFIYAEGSKSEAS